MQCVWSRQRPGAGWYFFRKASSTNSRASHKTWHYDQNRWLRWMKKNGKKMLPLGDIQIVSPFETPVPKSWLPVVKLIFASVQPPSSPRANGTVPFATEHWDPYWPRSTNIPSPWPRSWGKNCDKLNKKSWKQIGTRRNHETTINKFKPDHNSNHLKSFKLI